VGDRSHPKGRLSRRSRITLGLAILVHLSLLLSWRLGFWNRFTFDSTATHGRRGWDFYALYQAGHNVLTDVSVYESDNEEIEVVVPLYTPYRYLPMPACTLGVLFNLVSPLWAFRLWVATVELVLLGCAYLCYRLAADPDQGAVLAALWLGFTPYYLELYLGQFSLVQAALILVLMVAAVRPSWGRWGGPAWIASLLWKQNTALLAPVMLRLKRWRLLLAALLVVLLASAPYFARYPSALDAFLRNLQSGPPSHQLGNLGVRQWLYSLSSALAPYLDLGLHAGLQTAWVTLVLALCLWLTFAPGDPDALLLLCLWTSVYFLAYHDVWEHHYVLLLPVVAMLYRRTGSGLVLILYLCIALWTPYILIDPQGMAAYHAPMRWTPLQPRILDVLYHASKAVPALVLWAYIAGLIRRRTRAQTSP
ncbi:MAG: DUF2029 domain-containing protein, partial [Anaerolineae bacterium]|nr:DUF2029 domain-containing protein [Anaerolineae bacterium]